MKSLCFWWSHPLRAQQGFLSLVGFAMISMILRTSSMAQQVEASSSKDDLRFPPEFFSNDDGILDVTILLEETTHTIRGSGTITGSDTDITMTTRLFNSMYPGPTLRLKPGDTLRVNFVNNLIDQDIPYEHNAFSAPDESNLHFHGLYVSGELPSDDVTIAIRPSESYVYETTIPLDHMPGTHWMHPHRHGSSALQVGGGAVAAIIVEHPTTETNTTNVFNEVSTTTMSEPLPPVVANAQEVLLLIHLMDLEELTDVASRSRDTVLQYSSISSGNAPPSFVTVNGDIRPRVPMPANEWVRFRIIWASWWDDDLNLQIPNCELQLLAKDGVYIRDFPRRSLTNSVVPIPPAGRADVLVRCPNPDTNYPILARDDDVVIATIRTNSSTNGNLEDLPTSIWTPTYPKYLTDLREVQASTGCSCQTEFERDEVNGIPFGEKDASTGEYPFFHTSYLGAIVERTIQARDHPYHQHVYPYQIISGFRDNNNYVRPGDWHDTILGQGTVRYSPTVFGGKIMIHCHRLDHEDRGMMAIEYVNNINDGHCTCVAPESDLSLVAIIGIAVGGLLSIALIGLFVRRTCMTKVANPTRRASST